MTGWMRQELDQGHMTGPMMWGDPADLATTCRNWMSADPGSPAGVDPHACDDMVAWMASHAGDWGGWMMSGHMMGR